MEIMQNATKLVARLTATVSLAKYFEWLVGLTPATFNINLQFAIANPRFSLAIAGVTIR